MNAITIGPLVFATDRLAAVIGVGVFLGAATILARRFDPKLSFWSMNGLVAGLATARLGYVLENWESFAGAPWRALAIWQGGFRPMLGLLGLALASAWYIRSWRSGVFAAGIIGVGLLTWSVVTQLTALTLGQPAPTMVFNRLEGPSLALSDLRGRPVVVNVWATWCPPCRSEMPLLARTAREHPEVVFVFVNQGESADKIRAYLKNANLSIDNILTDDKMDLPRHYSTRGIPITLFLRADGSLANMHTGGISEDILLNNIKRISSRIQ